jgi:hypothetical protein
MRKSGFFIAISFAVLLLASCKKEEAAPVVPTVVTNTVNSLPADTIVGLVNGRPVGAGKYAFYSLESNTSIASADSNSKKWDIGFRGTSIITNGGNSGPGSGGGFTYVGTFDELKTISADSTFKVDNAPSSYAISAGWYSYNQPVNLITPAPGKILVIRTASGKYAKLEILNYYKGGVTPAASASDADKISKQRYYTFKFTYQSNGSKNF